VTLNELAYRRGSSDARSKFSSLNAAGAAPIPAAGGLNTVPPIGTTVPGANAAALKPGAPNQALPTSPVLGTGVPGTATIAGMGRTQAQGAAISAPPAAAPATPSTGGGAKLGSVYAPSTPPKSVKIPRQTATVGSNNTTETVKSAPTPAVTPAQAPTSATTSSSSSTTPGGAGSLSATFGGIVPSTGVVPAATLANESASNFRNQTIATSGGGK